jgi:mannosyl-glycoprotein endo-beta-N-acetylglucosaminidase
MASIRIQYGVSPRRWNDGTPGEVVRRVGARAADVYLGVDVFGRGTYGGGQVR